jgi:hypothetical protein
VLLHIFENAFSHRCIDETVGVSSHLRLTRGEFFIEVNPDVSMKNVCVCTLIFQVVVMFPSIVKVGTNFADKRCHSVGIVRSRTQATEFFCCYVYGTKFSLEPECECNCNLGGGGGPRNCFPCIACTRMPAHIHAHARALAGSGGLELASRINPKWI